jgi:hypothetical protein
MKEIPLTRGQVALVDDEDYEAVMEYRWCMRETTAGCMVAVRNAPKHVTDGPRQIQMHRWLLKAGHRIEVDHINGNTLDNRRSNLRLATRSQNLANRRTFSSTGYKGVTPYNHDKTRFVMHFEKVYTTAEEAARAYDQVAQLVHGEYARLNFPAAQ